MKTKSINKTQNKAITLVCVSMRSYSFLLTGRDVMFSEFDMGWIQQKDRSLSPVEI